MTYFYYRYDYYKSLYTKYVYRNDTYFVYNTESSTSHTVLCASYL